VTALQVYAFFVLPVLVLALGVAAYWWSGREARVHRRG